MLKHLFSRKTNPSEGLYGAIVAAARQPIFYQDWGVKDNVDGRFEILMIHMYLALERLKNEDEPFRQSLTDLFFADMDSALREMGVGDLGVGKKVRKMAEAFYGRVRAYTPCQDIASLTAAFSRNVYAVAEAPEGAAQLAHWALQARLKLQEQPASDIIKGRIEYS
jgi:cytochrome b pre-mRNA-processing protein 3